MKGTAMKTAICYATRSGSTAQAAEILRDKIGGADLYDITKRSALKKCRLNDYDAVIVGGPVRMGELDSAAITFISENKEVIAAKKHGFFILNFFEEHTESYLKTLFPKSLAENAPVAAFGAIINMKKLKGVDRMMMKMVEKQNGAAPSPSLNVAAIERFANDFSSMRW